MNYPFHIFENKKQSQALYDLFKITDHDQKKLESKISKILLPAGGIFQDGLSYNDFINKIAERRNIALPKMSSTSARERVLFEGISIQNLQEMPEAQRQELQEQLIQTAREKGFSNSEIGSISSIATIGAAQLSGMGVYLLASSTIGAVTSLVGVTLPFAFYTGMSSVISIAIGPIGLAIAAVPLYNTIKDVRSWKGLEDIGSKFYTGVKVIARGNYERAEVIFTYFASIRIMNIREYENSCKANNEQIIVSDKISQELIKELAVQREQIKTTQKEIHLQEQVLRRLNSSLAQQQTLETDTLKSRVFEEEKKNNLKKEILIFQEKKEKKEKKEKLTDLSFVERIQKLTK